MTADEFSREFDILYNNIASSSAPNIDEYEKSVYLTKAQLELVNNAFNPLGNKYNRGFEQSSKRRNDLNNLIVPYNTSRIIDIPRLDRISGDSKVFAIPDNVFLIIYEKAFSRDPKICGASIKNLKEINVKPITHEEYSILRENPFKVPDDREVWRIDSTYIPKNELIQNNKEEGIPRIVEVISKYSIDNYSIRYIKYPEPIILTNLRTDFPGEELTIDGKYLKQTSKLNKGIHPEILNRAVELADHDYKGGNFQTRIQVNQRDE